MKREYLVKTVEGIFGLEKSFQRVCNEASKDGWILQEFHFGLGDNHLLVSVFYRDK